MLLYDDDITLFERLLVAAHPWFKTFVKDEDTFAPHPSSMQGSRNILHKLTFRDVFKKIEFDKGALHQLISASERSVIVYVAKWMGQFEYNYFNWLFLDNNLPLVRYTNSLTMRRFMKWKTLWRSLKSQEEEIGRLGYPANPIRDDLLPKMISENENIMLVIPSMGIADEEMSYLSPVQTLIKLIGEQKNSQLNISIVPLDFLWKRRPEKAKGSFLDSFLAEKDSLGRIGRTVLFWRNFFSHGRAIIGEPVDLKSFIDWEGGNNANIESKLRGYLSETLRAKRRTLTGPPIRPRRFFLQELKGDDALDEKICAMAAKCGKPADDLRELSVKYAKEIVADINYNYLEVLDRFLSGVFKKLYENVYIDEAGLAKAKELYGDGPIVFVPNHKSHMDYLILSHLLHHNGMTVPHIAAGINLGFWPLGNIFRRCGAYFIRRAFRDNPLYRAVLEAYLKILIREGYCQEFFIEGSRSRTGKLMRPKMGMLTMLSGAAVAADVRNLKFIPVSITYDRVIEQKSYVGELEGAEKEKEKVSHILKLTKYLKQQQHRYGSIYVQFGEAIAAPLENQSPEGIFATAYEICHQINKNIVVTPQAVAAAAVLASSRQGIVIDEVKNSWEILLSYLEYKGVRISTRIKSSPAKAFEDSIAMLARTKLIEIHDDALEQFYFVPADKRVPISYFKNGIAHFFATISIVSTLLLKTRRTGGEENFDNLVKNFITSKKFVSHEFVMAARLSNEEHVLKTVNFLAGVNAVQLTNNTVIITTQGEQILKIFASVLRPFIETLWIAFRHISEKMNIAEEEGELISSMMKTGRDLYLLDRIQCKEAIIKAGFKEAINALCANGLVKKENRMFKIQPDPTTVNNLKVQLELIL